MYSSQFSEHFEHYPIVKKVFLGCFPIDNWPTKMKSREFFVSNSAPSGHKGLHWFVVFKSEDQVIELFDSLVASESTIRQLSRYGCAVETNETPTMNVTSKLCGHMCVYFCINRVLNPNEHFLDILSDFFSPDCSINEERVTSFIKAANELNINY